MVLTAKEENDGVLMEMPIRGHELIEYLRYLGKGQFFKLRRVPYNPSNLVMEIQFFNKQVLAPLERSYLTQYGANPFNDLKLNLYSETINDGECIIWSKNNCFLFIFHNYAAVIIKILKKNKKNIAKVAKSEACILEHFNYVT